MNAGCMEMSRLAHAPFAEAMQWQHRWRRTVMCSKPARCSTCTAGGRRPTLVWNAAFWARMRRTRGSAGADSTFCSRSQETQCPVIVLHAFPATMNYAPANL